MELSVVSAKKEEVSRCILVINCYVIPQCTK